MSDEVSCPRCGKPVTVLTSVNDDTYRCCPWCGWTDPASGYSYVWPQSTPVSDAAKIEALEKRVAELELQVRRLKNL